MKASSHEAKVAPAVSVTTPTVEPAAHGPRIAPTVDPEKESNHVWNLKDGADVRIIGSVASNASGMTEDLIRRDVEWDAWRVLQCYDEYFGQSPRAALQAGSVVFAFDIAERAPANIEIQRSDFTDSEFLTCAKEGFEMVDFAHGGSAKGHVVFSYRFVPTR